MFLVSSWGVPICNSDTCLPTKWLTVCILHLSDGRPLGGLFYLLCQSWEKSTFWWRKTARNDKNLGQILQSSPLAQKPWFVKYPNQITSRKFKRWFTRWSMNIYLHKKSLVSAQLTCWPVRWARAHAFTYGSTFVSTRSLVGHLLV